MDSILPWTRHDDKCFEAALMQFPENSPNFLHRISQCLRKPVQEVKNYYDALVYDIALIESGKVVLPKYKEDDNVSLKEAIQSKCEKKGKKQAIRWSSMEQRLFLEGLKMYGKGDWKNISRLCVMSKTPSQVASHAQKYYQRQNSKKKKTKRSSIHDMTLEDAENVTVPESNSKSMDQQPHCGDQILPDQLYDYLEEKLMLFDDGCLASFEELQGSSFYNEDLSYFRVLEFGVGF